MALFFKRALPISCNIFLRRNINLWNNSTGKKVLRIPKNEGWKSPTKFRYLATKTDGDKSQVAVNKTTSIDEKVLPNENQAVNREKSVVDEIADKKNAVVDKVDKIVDKVDEIAEKKNAVIDQVDAIPDKGMKMEIDKKENVGVKVDETDIGVDKENKVADQLVDKVEKTKNNVENTTDDIIIEEVGNKTNDTVSDVTANKTGNSAGDGQVKKSHIDDKDEEDEDDDSDSDSDSD